MAESTSVHLVFYTTAGCHLCEQAALLLEELSELRHINVDSVDISTDEALVNLSGIRIPVIRNPAKEKELGWPFQLDDLLTLT